MLFVFVFVLGDSTQTPNSIPFSLKYDHVIPVKVTQSNLREMHVKHVRAAGNLSHHHFLTQRRRQDFLPPLLELQIFLEFCHFLPVSKLTIRTVSNSIHIVPLPCSDNIVYK